MKVHDLPHRSSATEWWYLNSHFQTADGRNLSLFAAFFRIIKGQHPETKATEYAHSFTWALTDADGKVYLADSRVDPSAPKMGLERIKKGRGSRDPRLNRAITEILERGKVPQPDRMFDGPVHVGERRLELDFGGARLERLDDGRYRFSVDNQRLRAGCEIILEPQKPVQRHGDDGVVKGHGGEDMFYYFIPRNRVTGTVTYNGSVLPIVSGQGWYDHEFGGPTNDERAATPADKLGPSPQGRGGCDDESGDEERVDIAWNWCSLQLDGNLDVTCFSLQRVADGKVMHQWAVVVDAEGKSSSHHDMQMTPLGNWRSTRTFFDYPTRWQLRVPKAGVELELTAAFADQEFVTCISKPAFWEGRVDARGTVNGRAVGGLGYVERSGFEPVKDLDQFFTAVGEEVRKSVAKVIPTSPTADEARALVASDERPHYMDGLDLDQIGRALIKPIREIADRGGKSWRSYAALACCDVVQGDSRKFVQWLAMPELLHVGSLIVDDVQDRSTVRRGGPTAHLIYGEPLAINAGTAAYFLTQKLLVSDEVSNANKVRLYDLYFEVMRAGHAGQAVDLDGLAHEMPQVIESGDSTWLEKRVLATHRLKAAVPAGCLARMGAVVGGGSEAQIEAVGNFFEALGLAFQIVDDVLNLRGFKNNLKCRGEDISNGVITLPVAKAMARLDGEGRRALWRTLQSKPTDPVIVSAVVEKLETCGAVEACAQDARDLVERAWWKAEPLLEDSMPKLMMRAFGWYVLERHY
ncbi:MAG TPA: polyprenyl synthetase family protein [Polyangia bacterium]|nr:polyprenyl synthetase family protein [Polyangia bacterium]